MSTIVAVYITISLIYLYRQNYIMIIKNVNNNDKYYDQLYRGTILRYYVAIAIKYKETKQDSDNNFV